MAVNQSLILTEVPGSASAADNTSKVRILWQSTQTGESWNGYTRTAKYYVSVNGGAETEYSISYTLPKGTTTTLVDKTITVKHKADGTGTVKVRTWMNTAISAGVVQLSETLDLAKIEGASAITSAADITLGNKCNIKWTPASLSHRNKLRFALGGWSYTTGIINPGTTSAFTYTGYTIPVDVAAQIPDAKTGTMTVELYTYSDSGATNQIGTTSKTFKVTVPDSTNPVVSMELAPVGSLPASFDGLYIQGKTKVKATMSAEGQYGATIAAYTMSVEGGAYGSDVDYTSAYLANYGEVEVTGTATDSRGITGATTEKISVIPYSKPKILDVTASRCDADGNIAGNGTYLKIEARRSYSPAEQKNTCKIQYRYKAASATSYSDWVTILDGSESADAVETDALLGGVLDITASFHVQIRAIDDIGDYSDTTINIPTDEVYCHRARNALGLGKYVTGEHLFDCGWDANFDGEVRIGGVKLSDYIRSVISESEGE